MIISAIKYVFKENFTNLYRIYSIAKYELLADMRDSRFGIFWNFASPTIQVLTCWLVFGIAFNRQPVGDVPYIVWLVVGYANYWFIRPCFTDGCIAIYTKIHVISKMKFPVSVLPATIVSKELFNHGCMLAVTLVVVLAFGYTPSVYWLGILYYCFCTFVLGEGIAMILSVLTMLWRDIRKLVQSLMRALMYFSPVIWECQFANTVPHYQILNFILKLNPLYYTMTGYRDSFIYHTAFWEHAWLTLYFWLLVVVIYVIGCTLMYKFRTKFVDLY